MDNHTGVNENETDQSENNKSINNHVGNQQNNYHRDKIGDNIEDMKSKTKGSNKICDLENHGENVSFNDELEICESGKVFSDKISNTFKQTNHVSNKIDFLDPYQNSIGDIDSSDSDDLFISKTVANSVNNKIDHKVNANSIHDSNIVNHSSSIKYNVNTDVGNVLAPLDGEVKEKLLNGNSRNDETKSNISQPNVIQTQASDDSFTQTIPDKISDKTNLNNNVCQSDLEIKSDLNTFDNNLSDIVEKVNYLNSNRSPQVVFHTPHTTPIKLKLSGLPVQSHPLDPHALDGDDTDSYRNEPLDFPNSPVLNKSIDEICLKRYKRSQGGTSPNPPPPGGHEETRGKKQETEMNAIIKTVPSASASFESVTLSRNSPNSAEFTNNVSAESYLKKYDDINAQVRAYLNKTQENKSDLEILNERTHRYLNTQSADIQDVIGAASKVTYASDDEDTSVYDTIVSQDCHGVKLVKNLRKPNHLAVGASAVASTGKKLLTADLFSGNLLDDDMASLSDDELDDLLTPSLADDDLENSILEQLNLSDDDVESIQELSAREEREESRKWKICVVNGVEKRIDMKVIEPYKRVLSHGGYLSEGCHNAIIVFSACFLPHHSRADYHYVMDNLFFYVLHTLDQLVTEDYVLVYLHGATSRHNMPTFSWLKRCYQMIDRKLKKNLKQLYLVHATFWLKTIIVMSKPFISSKFSRKIQFIMSLTELQEKLPIEDASIPDKVRQYDKIKLSMQTQ